MEVRRTPVLVVLLLTVSLSAAQTKIKLCLTKINQQYCQQLSNLNVECIIGRDKIDCMRLVQDGGADIVQLEPPEIYTAGSYFNLEVAATNVVTDELRKVTYRFKTVAVVRTEGEIKKLDDLKGKKACFSSVGDAERWNIPIGIVLNKVNNIECKNRNELSTISSYFGPSCAAGTWSSDAEVNEKLKKENKNLCSICKSPDICDDKDEYSSINGSLKCFEDNDADVCFTTVERIKEFENSKYSLLCLNNTIAPVNEENSCVWAEMPTGGYLTKEGNTGTILDALKKMIAEVNAAESSPWLKNVFGDFNKIVEITDERKDWKNYLGNYIMTIDRALNCEKNVTFCTKSKDELTKCNSFTKAAYGRSLKPIIECVETNSSDDCISDIKNRNADLITLSGRDVYSVGKYDNLVPIASEEYSEENNISYYAVVVVKADSDIQSLKDLKGKKSCHTGMGRNAGWIIPIGEFIKLGIMDKKECDVAKVVADFFSESCIPGAKDKKYNPKLSGVDKLCKLCKDPDKCSMDDEYSGYFGAFRCLAEGRGDVAFVKNSTVLSLTDGNSQLPWARDLKSSDYNLLCPDGSKVNVSDYLKCNLAPVPSQRFVVTSNKMDQYDRLNTVYMLTSAGKLFNESSPIFNLFESYDNKNDLLFKSSAISLKSVKFDSKYDEVLDKDYLEALKMTDPKRCNSATTAVATLGVLICSALLSFFM